MMIRGGLIRSSRHRGTTLTEVVVASALLLVSIVPILQALTTAQTTARRIEWKTRSLTLALGKLDEIRAQANADFDQNFSETSVSLDGGYRCTVTDSYLLASLIRTIAVSVGYDNDGNGTLASGESQVTLTTQVARR